MTKIVNDLVFHLCLDRKWAVMGVQTDEMEIKCYGCNWVYPMPNHYLIMMRIFNTRIDRGDD